MSKGKQDEYGHLVDFVCEQIRSVAQDDEKAARSVAAEVVAEVTAETSGEVAAEAAAEAAVETAAEINA